MAQVAGARDAKNRTCPPYYIVLSPRDNAAVIFLQREKVELQLHNITDYRQACRTAQLIEDTSGKLEKEKKSIFVQLFNTIFRR